MRPQKARQLAKRLETWCLIVGFVLAGLAYHPIASPALAALGIVVALLAHRFRGQEKPTADALSKTVNQQCIFESVLSEYRHTGTPFPAIDRLDALSNNEKADLLDKVVTAKKGRLPNQNKYRESK